MLLDSNNGVLISSRLTVKKVIHTQWVADKAKKLAEKYGADAEKTYCAALLHDLGDSHYKRGHADFDTWSWGKGKEILKKAGFSKGERTEILEAIRTHSCHPGHLPTALEGKVLATADGMWHLPTNFFPVICYMARFANMTHGQYNANSLVDYKSRVKKVTNWYLQFLAKPGWTPETKPRTRKNTAKSNITNTVSDEPTSTEESTNSSQPQPTSDLVTPARSNLVAFPFPLASGTLATLYLPQSITTSDADRMARFVKTLVIDEGDSND